MTDAQLASRDPSPIGGRAARESRTADALYRLPVRVVSYCLPLLIVLAVWQLLSATGALDPRTMPAPSDIAAAGIQLLADPELYRHLGVTIYRAEIGLLFGVVLGVGLGLTMARFGVVNRIFYPLVALTYTLPKTALIPIVFLWLGVGDASNILVVFIGAFVPMVVTTYHGAEAVPEPLLWSARSMGTSNRRLLWSVVLPAALPQILNGVRIAHAFSIVIVISAEMVASYVGIGRFIFLYGEAGNYDLMFAAIGVIILAAFALDQLFLVLRDRALRWAEREGAST